MATPSVSDKPHTVHRPPSPAERDACLHFCLHVLEVTSRDPDSKQVTLTATQCNTDCLAIQLFRTETP